MKELIRRESTVNKREEFYKRFRWENYLLYPSLFLTQLSYFNSSLSADSHDNLTQLGYSIASDIERLYLENDELIIPKHYAALLNDLTSFVIDSKIDLDQIQLDSQLKKLRYLSISNLPQATLRDNAVKELSSILKKCCGQIEVKSEVEGLAFILDRLSENKTPQQHELERNIIEAILFDIGDITWAIPMSAVIKVYSTSIEKCTTLSKDVVIYQTELGVIPISFHSDLEQQKFTCGDQSTLMLIEGTTNRLIHIPGTLRIEKELSVQLDAGRYKRTAITKQGDVVWFYCTGSTAA